MSGREFAGKVALVTGGAAGIGRATAQAFAEAGAKVVVADIDANGGEETAAKIRAAGGEATFVRADVSQHNAVKALIKETAKRYGSLDCAHNNAGIEGQRARLGALAEEAWDRTIAINLKGVWLCMRYEITQMARQAGGAIVNTASVAGHVGLSRYGAYSASKHGVIGLTKTAALEYMRLGIRVNAVCPGFIETDMLKRALEGTTASGLSQQLMRRIRGGIVRRALAAQHPARRMGSAEEIAQAVLWLCSERASFVNGHALVIDGGFTAA